MKHPRSLRSRLLLGSVLGATAVLLVAGATVYGFARSRWIAAFDERLQVEAQSILSLIEEDETGVVDLELDKLDWNTATARGGGAYYQVWNEMGETLARSVSLGNGDLPRWMIEADRLRIAPQRLPDGRPGRMICLTARPHAERLDSDGQEQRTEASALITLALLRPTAEVDAALVYLAWLLAIVWLAATAALASLLNWIVVRGLRPADQLAQQVQEIDGVVASRRITIEQAPAELLPVVHRLNEMLDRVQAAFEHERLLLSNVAHELRTPLAGLRTVLEVSLKHPRDTDTYCQDMQDCLNITTNMQAMVDNLLIMARIESGQVQIEKEHFAIIPLIEQCWQDQQKRAEKRKLTLDVKASDQLMLYSDPAKFRVILRNLLDNAVSYCPDGSVIHVECLENAGTRELVVRNPLAAPGKQDMQHVFDRFWRADAARTADTGHCGLGLSLCRDLCRLLECRITATQDSDGDFVVRVMVPAG